MNRSSRSLAKDVDWSRLAIAVRRSRRALKPFREKRRAMIQAFAGSEWSSGDDVKPMPVNLLSLYVGVIGRSLISRNPRVMLSTSRREQSGTVAAMQTWVNRQIVKMRLSKTLQRVVTDSLFSIGVVKTALATPMDSANMAWRLSAGQPYCEPIDLDDFFVDLSAMSFEEVSFIGNRYYVPLAVAREMKGFGKRRKELQATQRKDYNEDGDESVRTMGQGDESGFTEEFEDQVELHDIYLPRHRVVVTISGDEVDSGGKWDGDDFEPLSVKPWVGPDCGPYHILGMGIVPGNLMPKAPLQDLSILNAVVNRLYRKLAAQSERQKEVLPVPGSASEDGERTIATSDGEAFRCETTTPLQAVSYGGPNQSVFLMADHLAQKFSMLGGNIELLGGMAPQARTATQDKMLNENSSRMVTDMQDAVVTFTAQVVESLNWYWHHHPNLRMQSTYSVAGMPEITTDETVEPEARHAVDYGDLDIRIDPYSLTYQSPQQRAEFLTQMLNLMSPMLPLLQQQGIGIDLNYYLRKMGEYGDQPDLTEMFKTQPAPAMDSQGPGEEEQPGMPAETTRNYNRTSAGAGSQDAQANELQNALMEGGGNWNGPVA